MPETQGFEESIQGIEAALRQLDSIGDPSVRARARDVVQSVMDLHSAGLRRMLELIFEQGEAGARLIDSLGDDGLAGGLMLLYGLHPLDLETRVRRALEKAALVVDACGGRLELLSVVSGTVELRFEGVSDPAKAARIKAAVDAEIYATAPDVVRISGLEMVAGADFFPIARLKTPAGPGPAAAMALQVAS